MELYIFRHGIAEDAVAGQSDADRALTDEGRKKTAEVVKTARRAGFEPSLIVSSPYLRAIQTARIAADEFGYRGRGGAHRNAGSARHPGRCLERTAGLPGGSGGSAGRARAAVEPAGSVSPCGARSLRVEMKKAAMVRIDLESFGPAPHGTLRWMITPKLAG